MNFYCEDPASALPPTSVLNVSFAYPQHSPDGFDDVYRLVLQWQPPETSNGNLEEYQIEILDPEAGDSSPPVRRIAGLEVRMISVLLPSVI